MKIAVIGSGYVGLVAGACFAEIGHQVICADNDANKVAALQAGDVLIHERHLPELVHRHRGERLRFTASTADAVRESEVVFIAVATPTGKNGAADMFCVESAAKDIAGAINGFKLIVQKSTVPAHANQWLHETLIAHGAPIGQFEIVSNPEFLREGTAVTDFLYPDRIVIGASSVRALDLMRKIYAPLVTGRYAATPGRIARPECATSVPELLETSAKSAELIKYASNAFLAMKISFINALACVCESVGADVEDISRGIGADTRIGPKFLRAGLGYGGSCFPKDISAFKSLAADFGHDLKLLDEIMRINQEQRQLFLQKVRDAVGPLKDKRLGVLGLSFKGGTDDIRHSPAIAVIQALLAEQANVVVFDPAAMERARHELSGKRLEFAKDAYSVASDADALLVLTDWQEFAGLDLQRIKKALRSATIVDGRNLFDKEDMAVLGFNYYSVGRSPVLSAITAELAVVASSRR